MRDEQDRHLVLCDIPRCDNGHIRRIVERPVISERWHRWSWFLRGDNFSALSSIWRGIFPFTVCCSLPPDAKCPFMTQTGHQPTLRATPSSTPIRYHTCLKSRGRPRFPSPAPAYRCPLLRSLLGVKRTWVGALQMSAFDPKRTSLARSPFN